MCASAHVSLTSSLFSRRSTLWSGFTCAEIFSSSCNTFVTHFTLSWPHGTQIDGTRSRGSIPGPDVWAGDRGITFFESPFDEAADLGPIEAPCHSSSAWVSPLPEGR